MRLDSACCICRCSESRPSIPVTTVVQPGQAPDAACASKCQEEEACGQQGGVFSQQFCE